jgi:hypothetical protein
MTPYPSRAAERQIRYPLDAYSIAYAAGYYSGRLARVVTARERAVFGHAGTVRSTVKNSHGTSNSVIYVLGKSMSGLFQHSVCPYQQGRERIRYATKP